MSHFFQQIEAALLPSAIHFASNIGLYNLALKTEAKTCYFGGVINNAN
ncbi:MAG: hypothetical protein WCS87_15895 [Methylococcaceae bacterium]